MTNLQTQSALAALLAMMLLASGPSSADIQNQQQYESELKTIVDQLEQNQRDITIDPVGLGDRTKAREFKAELESMAKGDDYPSFLKALQERELTITKNPMMSMILYVHPYQNENSGFLLGSAIIDGNQEALEEALKTVDSSLDESVYIDAYLGYTPLVMAVQNKRPAMVEALLNAGANPNAKSAHMSVTPLEVAQLLGQKSIMELLVKSGAK